MRYQATGLVLLLLLAGCGGSGPPEITPAGHPTMSGTWALSHAQQGNDCAGEGELFPVAPGDVVIEHSGAQVTLSSRGEEPRRYAAEPDSWTRQLSEQIEGCDLTLTETWRLHGVSQSRLSATYEAALELRGDCAFTGSQSCSVRHAVWGVRR